MDFERRLPEDIDALLANFFQKARKKNGKPFSSSALIAFRTALTRYLNEPPFFRNIKLAQDARFTKSNTILHKQIAQMREVVKQVESITPEDHLLLYRSGVLGDRHPTCLLQKVWFELQWHFGRPGGRRSWAAVPPDCFIFATDSGGEFVSLRPLGGEEGFLYEKARKMYAAGGPNCPVQSLKKYLEKRNPFCSAFLQTPNKHFQEENDVWYFPEAMKDSKLKYLMKHLSKQARLSKIYSNLSVCHHLLNPREAEAVLQDDASS